MRRLSFYLSIIRYNLFRKKKTKIPKILLAKGVHFIGGATGSGKTLLSSIIINELCDNKDFFFWTNLNQYDEKNTKVFSFNDIFANSKLVKKLDNFNCAGLVIDEANLNFNRRLNRTNEYNDIFLGMQQLIVAHRHLAIPRVYLLGQDIELQDIQLQRDFKFYHEVYKSEKFSYEIFCKDNKLVKVPKKLHIITSVKVKNKWVQLKPEKIKVKHQMLERYKHLGFADYFHNLPIYKK